MRLGREVVDFNDDAINLVHEGVALFAVAVDEIEDALDRIGQLAIGAHGQAPGGEQVVVSNWVAISRPVREPMPCTYMLSGREAVTAASFWRREPAAALRGFAKGFFAGGNHGLVELLKVGGGDEHFAANLDFFGEVLAAQLLRDACNGANVMGDVLAGGAVAAGCGARGCRCGRAGSRPDRRSLARSASAGRRR